MWTVTRSACLQSIGCTSIVSSTLNSLILSKNIQSNIFMKLFFKYVTVKLISKLTYIHDYYSMQVVPGLCVFDQWILVVVFFKSYIEKQTTKSLDPHAQPPEIWNLILIRTNTTTVSVLFDDKTNPVTKTLFYTLFLNSTVLNIK